MLDMDASDGVDWVGEERDVIVVGAGPAGSTTAAFLARQGHDVLLLDRHGFPRDKICGDAVPAGAIKMLYELGGQEKVAQAVARGELYPLEKMLLVGPNGRGMEARFTEGLMGTDAYIAPRIHFDYLVQQLAVAQGAQFCQGMVKAPLLENGRIVGVQVQENGRLQNKRAKAVIGADGVTSVITRALRPKSNQHTNNHRAVALRAYIEDIEEIPQTVEFYLYRDILPGYAWIFPTGKNRANIGLGMRLDHFRKRQGNLKQLLQKFLQMPDIKKRLKQGGKLSNIATWQLNFGSQKQLQHVYNGALLVGDAAGLINPVTGGGIHNAMISARLAAQTVGEALQAGDTSRQALAIYAQRLHDHMWQGMTTSYRIQRTLLTFPWLVDWLIWGLKENSTLAQTFLSKL